MKTNHLSAILLATAALAACAKDPLFEDASGSGAIPIAVTGSIRQVQTRATAQGFVDKDAVGLFAVNYTDDNTVAGTLAARGNQADNVKYVFDESNQKWNPVKAVYYKNINTNVDIFLYYPYQKSITDVSEGGFEVSKDQSAAATATSLCGYEASDFLWGKGEAVTPKESAVQISLSHRLSAVNVTLVEKDGFQGGEFETLSKSVILTNTTRKARIDYSTGVATPLGDPQLDGIVMCPQSDGTFRCIVIPQTVAAGKRLFSITIDGISYGFSQSGAVEYQAGKQLNVNINVSKDAQTGTYSIDLGSTQIVDWTEDKNTHGGEARQYYVVNVSTPGTLGQLIRAAGKNPNKIKNLKVSGTVTTSDFYFMRDSMAILEAVNMKEAKVVESYYGRNLPTMDDAIPYKAFFNKTSLCYFEFPEDIRIVGEESFYKCGLSGTIVFPDGVVEICLCAFNYCSRLSGISWPADLQEIGACAFQYCSSLSGTLVLPMTVHTIGNYAFESCNFSGNLILPENLEYIGSSAFRESGEYTGGLTFPDKVTKLNGGTFDFGMSKYSFDGVLDLNNVTELGSSEFVGCQFSGELVIPEGVVSIPTDCFYGYIQRGKLTSIKFPSTLKEIGQRAFRWQPRLCRQLDFPEGLVTIMSGAFDGDNNIPGIVLPSTITTVQSNAFCDCSGISSFVCKAVEPPTIMSGAFNGIAKDNFTVEVPAQSVKSYQAEPGWSDFKRISAHYDFSLNRKIIRVLNESYEKTLTLRAPANYAWSVETPDWITVTPSSGTGKTDVTVSISAMPRTNDLFEVDEGTYNKPKIVNYKGRCDEIVFTLTDNGYTCNVDVEQYDYDYSDGDVQTFCTATAGSGIDIVFIADGYDAKDIATGKLLSDAEAGYGHLFDIEPYKTYKDYFNVKAVVSMSDESGIGTVNTIIDTKFGSYFSQNRILTPAAEPCFAWAKKANASMDLTKSLTIMLMNTSTYEGVCMMYDDGSAIACCPVSTESYPYDFRGIIQHEAGGHGFGKLGDEYIYHNAFIQTCICNDGCEHPSSDSDLRTTFGRMKSHGWFKNISMSSDPNLVPWSHLIYNTAYSDYVDMYEGGYMHSRGVYRSEATSCMNNNIPYYSAISRQSIVERIMYCAGQNFSLQDFYDNDSDDFGPTTKGGYSPIDRSYGIDPLWNRGSEQGSVVYMGEHPDYSKIK